MIDPAAPAPVGNMGQPIPRYDARVKVTGKALYAADVALPDAAYAYLLSSRIAKGRIKSFDLRAARALPGVLDILTYQTIGGDIRKVKYFTEGGPASNSVVPLGSAEIAYAGQTIAVVVGETLEVAQDAAYQIGVEYEEQPSAATFDSKGTLEQKLAGQNKKHDDPKVGDFAAAYEAAPVKIDVGYSTPTQHHNPIELFATQCVWNGAQLTVHEPSQNVYGIKNGLAAQLGVEPSQIRVISRYVGGAFGSKGALTQRTAIVAIAARRTRQASETRAHPRTGLYDCDIPGGDAAPHPTRGDAGWKTSGAQSRRVRGHVSSRSLRGRRHRRFNADVRLPQRRQQCEDRARRPLDARLHASASRNALFLCSRKRDGRTCGCAEDGSDRTAPRQRHADRADQRVALHKPRPHDLFRSSCRGVRLESARSDAGVEARR